MNIVLYMDDINYDYINFLDSKDNMITDGLFTKIIYSDDIFSMNGLHFYFPINIESINTNYNRTFIRFDINDELNKKIISLLTSIETRLLKTYNFLKNKNHKNIFKTQLESGYVKIHTNNKHHINNQTCYIVKISGIWESKNDIGITYKIIPIEKNVNITMQSS